MSTPQIQEKKPTPRKIKAPINTSRLLNVIVTSPWFVEDTEYAPRQATFAPLVNGEKAFRAVHQAIMAAQKSIDIICWGFQPSMYFVRDGQSPPIGKVLYDKALAGVKVRILCWQMTDLNLAQLGLENNTPGLNWLSGLPIVGSEQAKFDARWYHTATSKSGSMPNLRFVGRGFDLGEHLEMYWHSERQMQLGIQHSAALSGFTTHHQKTVLVDYALPDKAVGFVMGHNMLDEYWDTDQHSIKKHAANRGRNGNGPRQDISSRVTGPILEHLHHNFSLAWEKATGEDLIAQRNATAVAEQLKPRTSQGTPLVAQLLLTQSQENRVDIASLYVNAINNATQFVYCENQYFRWPQLAEVLRQCAAEQYRQQRKPEQHGAIHLFVVTNSSDEGMGDGTVSTYTMLDILGRADVIPKVARLERMDDASARLGQAEHAERLAKVVYYSIRLSGQDSRQAEETLRQASARREQAEQAYRDASKPNKPVLPQAIPGLKVHICTLVAPDSVGSTPPAPLPAVCTRAARGSSPIPARRYRGPRYISTPS